MINKKIFSFLSKNLKNYYSWRDNKKEYLHLKGLYRNAKREKSINKTVVFNTVRTFKNVLDRELFIGKLLALKGAKIIILLDDGILKHWDSIKIEYLKDINRIADVNYNLFPRINKIPFNLINVILSKINIKRALNTYQDKNLTVIYYSKIIKEIKYENWEELKKFAKSSTIRFFKNSEFDFNNEYVKYYYKLSLINSIISRYVGKYVLNILKPDLFITSHGIYSTWGPAFEFLKNNGITSYIYAGKHSHSEDVHDIYFIDSKVQTLSRSKIWEEYKNTPITKSMEDKVKALFAARIRHSTKDTKIYYNGDIQQIKVDKNEGYKYHIAIFPNLIWDGNIEDRHIAFDGIMDWLISTLNFFKNRKDIKIYVKFHPAEVTLFKTTPKIQDLLRKSINLQDFKNLVLIPSENKVDAYQFLLSGIDFAICYDGILALEIPFLKIPTLLGGVGGRFSVEGGNFNIKSREEYFKYLDDLEDTISEFHRNYRKYYENIIRYSYWYLFGNIIKLPTLSNKSIYGTDLFQLTKKDINLDEKILKLF